MKLRTEEKQRMVWTERVQSFIKYLTGKGKTKASDEDVSLSKRYLEEMAEEADRYHNLREVLKMYYQYKRKTDEDIRKELKKIKILVETNKGKGTLHGYYELSEKSIEKILEKPRNVSLTFDVTEIGNYLGDIQWREIMTINFLCKSTSRFFLKPDIGEILDQIPFELYCSPDELKGIRVHSGYETLPDSQGEHHIMQATLYTF
jgi:hypothetical protein